MTPFDGRRRLAPLRAPRPHDQLGRRAGPGAARPALRMGGLRRARDHRPLGADGRAARPGSCSSSLDRAERPVRRPASTTRTCSALGVEADPVDPRERVRAARRRSWTGSRRTAASRTSRTPTGAACAPSSGRPARGCVGIEVWNAGCELELGRGDVVAALGRGARARAPAATRSRPTTRTTPATTAASPGRWVRAAERTQAAVLDALRSGAFYGSTGPEIDARRGDRRRGHGALQPGRERRRSTPGRRRGARANAGRLGYPHNAEILERDTAGLITAVPARAPLGRARTAASRSPTPSGGRAWTNPLWIA